RKAFCSNSISETKWMKTRMPVTVFWETGELTAFLLIINAMTYKMTAMTANMPISVIECPTLRSSNAMTRPTTGRAIFSQNEYWLVYEKYFFMFFSRSEEHTSELQSRFELVCRL